MAKRDPRELIQALVNKTEENGASPEEAEAALTKARGLAERHGLSLEDFQPVTCMSNGGPKPEPEKEAVQPKRKPKAEKPTDGRFKTIREAAEHYLSAEPDLSHKEVAAKVREHFPEANTSGASVAWYASKLRRPKANDRPE